MGEAQFGDGVGDALRFARLQRLREPRAHVAEGAGPRARVAHDHERRVLLFPAFADIGTARFLANGDEAVLAHDFLRFREFFGAGRLDPDPGRFSGDRLIGPMRFLGMARARDLPASARIIVEEIEHNGHEISPAARTRRLAYL